MNSILIVTLALTASAAVVLVGWVLWRRRRGGSAAGAAEDGAPAHAPELKDSGEDINKVKRRMDFEIQKNVAQAEMADRLSNATRAARRAQHPGE